MSQQDGVNIAIIVQYILNNFGSNQSLYCNPLDRKNITLLWEVDYAPKKNHTVSYPSHTTTHCKRHDRCRAN